MNSRGFTLVELIVAIAVITILSTVAVLNWNRMSVKAAVEGQVKIVHADMMSTRLLALYGKKSRSVVVYGKVFNVYSSTATTVAPVSSRTFKYKFIPAGVNKVTFDTSGMMNGTQVTLCVDPYNSTTKFSDAFVDSLVISQARINLGKRGGNCDTNGVDQK